MLKYIKKKAQNIKSEDIKKGVTGTSKVIVEEGVEVVKDGIFSIVNGIIIKVIMGVALIVAITAGGCVGTSVIIDKVTTKESIEK